MSRFAFAAGSGEIEGFDGARPRYNGAPRQTFAIIVREPDHPGGMFVTARWGFVPYWSKDDAPKLQPINARAERVPSTGMFRHAYRSQRGLLPVDGFFEWKAIKGEKVKQPYALAMKDGSPFALAILWDERGHTRGGHERTFTVVTCDANELVGEIHDRMPVIVAPEDYHRWISEEPDPRDLMRPFPSDLMTMWPISTRVNSPRYDEPDILDPLA